MIEASKLFTVTFIYPIATPVIAKSQRYQSNQLSLYQCHLYQNVYYNLRCPLVLILK